MILTTILPFIGWSLTNEGSGPTCQQIKPQILCKKRDERGSKDEKKNNW